MNVLRALLLILVLPASLLAQDQPPKQAPAQTAAPKKAKHVWTNDDIGQAGGDISVVGGSKPGEAATTTTRRAARQEGEAEACASDAWVIALVSILRDQGVKPNPVYWRDRLFGGACKTATVAEVAKAADGEHTFDDGTHFRVKMTASGTWPQGAAIVAASTKNQAFIVTYKGEPYITTWVDFIDHSYSDGGHVYVVSKVQLTQPITGHVVIYDAKQPIKIDGTLVASVTK